MWAAATVRMSDIFKKHLAGIQAISHLTFFFWNELYICIPGNLKWPSIGSTAELHLNGNLITLGNLTQCHLLTTWNVILPTRVSVVIFKTTRFKACMNEKPGILNSNISTFLFLLLLFPLSPCYCFTQFSSLARFPCVCVCFFWFFFICVFYALLLSRFYARTHTRRDADTNTLRPRASHNTHRLKVCNVHWKAFTWHSTLFCSHSSLSHP